MNKALTIIRRAAWAALFCALLQATPLPDRIDSDAVAGTPAALAGQKRVTDVQEGHPPTQSQQGTSLISRAIAAVSRLLTELGVDAEAVSLYAKWIVGAPALVMIILIAMLLRPRREPPSQPSPARIRTGTTTQPLARPTRRTTSRAAKAKMDKFSDKERILRFFFDLFKNQTTADANAPATLTLVETRPTCPDETYEMRIQHGGDWAVRRMSIGLLGQGGGSRSKCFYVIYDAHMVVKIPPDPITEFSEYNRQIAAEARIVSRLAPRPCIVPRVSVILKAIHTLPASEHLSDDALEKKYTHLVEVKPWFQEYLEIGSSFAFFMDLAKHFFLSTILEDIHRGHARLLDEALQYPDLLWDQHGFVCRYGEETGTVCHDLQEAYYHCEGRLRRLVADARCASEVPAFHLKNWFLTHLAGEKIDPTGQELPAALIDKVNRLLFKVVKSHHRQVEFYRQKLKAYIRETRFSQHRLRLENLAANTLDLLVWIGAKGLALRDLKPENLFVAGNPEEYPLFLNDARQFAIGLIDVETAVVIDADNPDDIPQPQLAGTPLYATPAHLMSNTVLQEIYTDLRTVLHLQDWYATMAIIFKIITGENLFATTARVFPEIINQLKLLDPAGPDLKDDVIRINRLFWNSAVAELQAVLTHHADRLTRVDIAVPAAIGPELRQSLEKDIAQLEEAVATAVAGQSFFTSDDKRRYLLAASAEKIAQMKHKLIESRETTTQQRSDILIFFDQVGALKERLQRKQLAAAALNTPAAVIAADQLLEAMFERVLRVMYPTDWPPLAPDLWQGQTDLPADISTYQATM